MREPPVIVEHRCRRCDRSIAWDGICSTCAGEAQTAKAAHRSDAETIADLRAGVKAVACQLEIDHASAARIKGNAKYDVESLAAAARALRRLLKGGE
jgi:hypothetical protein